MKNPNKDQIKQVLQEYERLPDTDMLSKNLYDALVDTCNNGNKEVTNGEVMNTLKLMVIQMCEKMVIDTNKWSNTPNNDEGFTSTIQEKYKWITTNKISLHNEQDSDQH